MNFEYPNVMTDKGFINESIEFAKNEMEGCGRMTLDALPDIIRNTIARAYLRGAQSAINYGYAIAWKEQKAQLPGYREAVKRYEQAKAESK